MDFEWSVSGDGFVRADGVVLGPIGIGVFDRVRDVANLFEAQTFVLQGTEAAFA